MRKAQITHLGCLVGQVLWQSHFKSIGLLANVIGPLSSWFYLACVTLCVLPLSITVAISVGPEGTGRLSLCPASPCLVSCWGDQQDLAARAPGVFPKQHGGRQAGKLCITAVIYCYFFSPSFWLCRPPNALNGDMARLYVNFKPADKRFAFLLTSHGSFTR